MKNEISRAALPSDVAQAPIYQALLPDMASDVHKWVDVSATSYEGFMAIGKRVRIVYAAPVAAQAPEGWKLVPVESTWEMDKAGRGVLPDSVMSVDAERCYNAMIAAAPPPPVAHCQCSACKNGVIHASDCAVHNGPAEPVGPCDCGAAAPQAPVADGARAPQPNHRLMGRLRRFNECCEDFEADGHDVDKEDMRALADLGAVRPAPGGRHYMTDFGRYLLAAPAQQAVTLTDAARLPIIENGYFVYDPANMGVVLCDSDEERAELHAEALAEARRDAKIDREWPDDVDGIVSGVITHKTVETNVEGDQCDYVIAALQSHSTGDQQ